MTEIRRSGFTPQFSPDISRNSSRYTQISLSVAQRKADGIWPLGANLRHHPQDSRQHPMIKKAVIYGSRAKGNYKNGSDIDLTLMGDALDYKTLSAVAGELDESFSSRASIRFTMAMAAPGAS